MSKEAASTTKFQAWAHGFGIGRVNKGLVSWHQHGAFGVPLGHVQIARSQTSSEFLRDIMSGLMQLPNWLYMPWIGFQNWGLPAIRQKLGTYVSSSAWPRQMIRAIVRPSRSINTPFPSISSTQVTVDPHKNLLNDHHMAMDQYLLIPFLVGWTSIYQLFWCSPGVQGFDTLPYSTAGFRKVAPPWLTPFCPSAVRARAPRTYPSSWPFFVWKGGQWKGTTGVIHIELEWIIITIYISG